MSELYEAGFIACLVRRPDETAEAALARFYESGQIDPGQLQSERYREMYAFIHDLALDDVAVTPQILGEKFGMRGESWATTFANHPPDMLPYYLKEINREHIKGVALVTAEKLKAVAGSGDPQQFLEAVQALDGLDLGEEKRVYSLAEQAAVFLAAFEADQARLRNKEVKPQFPLAALNRMVPRIMDDDILLVTARSKVGKSSFSTQFAYTNARAGLNVCYFHFEDPPARVGYRRAAQLQAYLPADTRAAASGTPYGLPYRKMMSGALSEAEQSYVRWLTTQAVREAGTNLTYVYASGWTCEKMLAVWRQLHKQRPFDLVIVDYLNKMALSGQKLNHFGQWGSRGQDVELIKQEAGRPGARVPVVLVQQENEDGSARDSKDSYIKSQVWISLQREACETDPDRFLDDGEVVVKRANDGETGSVPATFYAPYMIWSQK